MYMLWQENDAQRLCCNFCCCLEHIVCSAVSLGQLSKPSFVSLSSDAVELIILLPTSGSPPILKYEVTFSSDSAPSIVIPVTGVFETGEMVTLSVGGSSSNKELLSSTDYRVSFRAYNLAGWSPGSPETHFTTCKSLNTMHAKCDSVNVCL